MFSAQTHLTSLTSENKIWRMHARLQGSAQDHFCPPQQLFRALGFGRNFRQHLPEASKKAAQQLIETPTKANEGLGSSFVYQACQGSAFLTQKARKQLNKRAGCLAQLVFLRLPHTAMASNFDSNHTTGVTLLKGSSCRAVLRILTPGTQWRTWQICKACK